MFFDPEFDDQIGELVAVIQTTPYSDEAFEQLLRFDERWWYETPPLRTGTLVFDVEPA